VAIRRKKKKKPEDKNIMGGHNEADYHANAKKIVSLKY